MASKGGKKEAKNRDTLPRSPSNLDDDSKKMAKPRDRSSSSSSSEDEIRTSTSNGFKYDVEKFQFLSIKELNEKLEKYIEDVKDLGLSHGKPSSNISINIDRYQSNNVLWKTCYSIIAGARFPVSIPSLMKSLMTGRKNTMRKIYRLRNFLL